MNNSESVKGKIEYEKLIIVILKCLLSTYYVPVIIFLHRLICLILTITPILQMKKQRQKRLNKLLKVIQLESSKCFI